MSQTMTHRGPDDDGCFVSKNIGLGFRRLSIIDLTGGHQPMPDNEGSIWVVFNGEIYNFQSLRKELQHLGYTFKTKSDTEVIVYGYKQWKENVFAHLNGMFGLAIWDEKSRKLIVARDRLGIKPLYYFISHDTIYFASEIRSLVAVLSEKPSFDPKAMSLFLRFRYTPSPYTIYTGINKLAAGTYLVSENGNYLIKRWWSYVPVPFDQSLTFSEAREKLLELYKKAVARQLISDVPLGILLSGGLDSGLLLALMNSFGNGWKSFTVGFREKFANDEIPTAASTAKSFQSPHESIRIDKSDFITMLPKVLSIVEEPVTASSIVPMYYLCKLARQRVKVALMGQGPDELFGGYKRHLGLYYGRYWRRLPKWIREYISGILEHLPRSEPIKRGLYALRPSDAMSLYQRVFSIAPRDLIESIFRDGTLPQNSNNLISMCWEDLLPLMHSTDELGGLQYLELRSSLPDELLLYADKLSMAHGLEVRVPYLDHDIVEFVERLPTKFKINGGKGKFLHRQLCEELLPQEILKRRKIGFETPIDQWLRESADSLLTETLLDNSSLIYKYLRPDRVRLILHDHKLGKSNNFKILFSIIALEYCMRNYTQLI